MSDGAPASAHFASAARQLAADGKKELAARVPTKHPPFPYEVAHLWDWFNEFAWGLKATGMGPPTASWVDVLAWCQAAEIEAEPWERKALVRLAYARALVVQEMAKKAEIS